MTKAERGKIRRKKRYLRKKYDAAPMVECACKCGKFRKSIDKTGRPATFISGHNGRKYDDPIQFKREWNHRNREWRYEWRRKMFRRRKVKLIHLMGGACKDCGVKYDGKNASIFHLHHRDPRTKLFSVGNQLMNKAWSTILSEVKKCDLICANCHERRHSAEF